jgi:hypothetical protein
MSRNALALDGEITVAGNYATTPDSVATSVTSDIDIRVEVALADWTPVIEGIQGLLGKWAGTGNESYRFYVTPAGTLKFDITSDGGTAIPAESTVATGFADGSTHWVRVTWLNSANRCQFFTSSDGVSWTQLGADVTQAAPGIYDSTTALVVGAMDAGFGFWITGYLFHAEVRDGINGTVVASFDATAVTRIGPRNPSTVAAGGPWTILGESWQWVEVAEVSIGGWGVGFVRMGSH